ncbi:hypothetical protein D9M72_271690 [compost metagenome]
MSVSGRQIEVKSPVPLAGLGALLMGHFWGKSAAKACQPMPKTDVNFSRGDCSNRRHRKASGQNPENTHAQWVCVR